MSISEKRKKVMNMLCSALDKIDPSKANSKKYQDFFGNMSDSQFDSWMKDFLKDKKNNFYLEIIEYDRPLKMENIEAMAKHIGVPLYEKVAIPHLNMNKDNPVVTPEPVPVGYAHEKLMVQLLSKKNSTSIRAEKRNVLSGQVTGDDKTSRTSDVESYSFLAIGATESLKELLGPRADDMIAKNQMYNSIQKNGYCSLKELDSNNEDKVSLRTLDAYFLMMGIKTNLITGGDIIISPKEK
jgi:hypothetical protein